MSDRLAILLWAAEPAAPQLCAAPFHFAAAAAAFDAEVEMYFTARSVRLLLPAVSTSLQLGREGETVPLSFYLEEALRFGVRLYACPAALNAHLDASESLPPELCGHAGAAAFLGRLFDPQWRTLSF